MSKGEATVHEPTRAEQAVARRMAESKATIPHFALAADIDMEQVREGSPATPLVVSACARALREHPRINGAYRDGRFELYSRVNIGIAVAAGDAVVVPTVFDADRKPLDEIAGEVRTLVERARQGTITPPELASGTFTVFDLGTSGVTGFTGVIQPQQAALLTLGSIAPRAVARGSEVVVRRTVTATLSCDHRIISPAGAAAFLGRLRAHVEQPEDQEAQ